MPAWPATVPAYGSAPDVRVYPPVQYSAPRGGRQGRGGYAEDKEDVDVEEDNAIITVAYTVAPPTTTTRIEPVATGQGQ